MKSRAARPFRDAFRRLPSNVQATARQAYKRFQTDPGHPSLRFKHVRNDIWSVRVGIAYRALGERISADEIIWFWIGSHAEYNHLIAP